MIHKQHKTKLVLPMRLTVGILLLALASGFAPLPNGVRLTPGLELAYREQTDETIVVRKAKGWFHKQEEEPAPSQEQQVVDDYLEFLDRRYHRLHDEKESRFSAWNWLMQGSGQEPLTVQADHIHDDALYVLGVANLASRKLLQKHHKLHRQALDGVVDAAAITEHKAKKAGGLFRAIEPAASPRKSRFRGKGDKLVTRLLLLLGKTPSQQVSHDDDDSSLVQTRKVSASMAAASFLLMMMKLQATKDTTATTHEYTYTKSHCD